MPFTYEYPRPAVTVDVVLFAVPPGEGARVLLIRRARDPFAGTWALPGGFLDMHEELATGAVRVLQEETGVRWKEKQLLQLGAYGGVHRDPRGRPRYTGYAWRRRGQTDTSRSGHRRR